MRSPSVADIWHTHYYSHYVTNKRLRERDQETGVDIILFLLCPILIPTRSPGNVLLLQQPNNNQLLLQAVMFLQKVQRFVSATSLSGLGSVTGHCLWALSRQSGTRSGLSLVPFQFSLVSIIPTKLQTLYNISS